MNQFHQFLKQLDKLDKTNPGYQSSTPHFKIAPRKFPKRQYKKLNHRLLLLLFCVILLSGAGISYGGFHLKQQIHPVATQQSQKYSYSSHSSHQTKSPDKLIQPNKVSANTTDPNKRLLKSWLIKLNYSKAKIQDILAIYQQAAPFRKRLISHQLHQVTDNHLKESIKEQQIYDILNQSKMINQNVMPQSRYPTNYYQSGVQPLARKY